MNCLFEHKYSDTMLFSFFFFFLIFGCAECSLLHRLFSGCVRGGSSPVAICRLLIVMVSLVVECGLWGMWASVVVAHGLNSCGSRA